MSGLLNSDIYLKKKTLEFNGMKKSDNTKGHQIKAVILPKCTLFSK